MLLDFIKECRFASGFSTNKNIYTTLYHTPDILGQLNLNEKCSKFKQMLRPSNNKKSYSQTKKHILC